ncbi:MAG: ArnT family glycosyltransferase [Silvanigrellaceae bacterium]
MTKPVLAGGRRSLEALLSPMVTIFLGGLVVLFCIRSFAIEPFDFDEAIYRRMAEEMKAAGHWLSQPLFNGENYNHKPPTYIGALALASWLLDGSEPQVTAFSSRFVSLVFTFLTLFFLSQTWKKLTGRKPELRFEERHEHRIGISPVYFYLMCFLPSIASTAVLLDPFLVLFTSVFVCSESIRIHARMSGMRPARVWWFLSFVGMSGATATKGLVGLVLPAGTAFLFCFWQNAAMFSRNKLQFLRESVRSGLVEFFPQTLLAALASAVFYWFLWSTGGAAFVEEFFVKHHFGRATSAMEGHGGSVAYYLPIFLVGGGLTISWLMAGAFLPKAQLNGSTHMSKQSPEALRSVRRWLLSWTLLCALFFSLLATKLPNYIWPVWPALALLASLGPLESDQSWKPRTLRLLRVIAFSIPFLLPVVFLLLASGLLLWEPLLADYFQLKERESAILASALLRRVELAAGFFISGISLLLAATILKSWISRAGVTRRLTSLHSLGVVRILSMLQMLACTALMLFVVPAAEDVMTGVVQQSTARARMFLGLGEKLSTADLYSPNVVSASQEPVVLGTGEAEWLFADPKTTVVLTPVWNVSVCTKAGFDVVMGVEYLHVCLKSYRETLEGRKP